MTHGASHAAPAKRPAIEVADILRAGFDDYRARHRLSCEQIRAARAIMDCRTAALGAIRLRCDTCDEVTIQYASCRNRHCPKCQTLTQTRWVERQSARLLDIGYWHCVFTLPHELNALAKANPELVYSTLFKAASATLLEFGRDKRHLGGRIGFTMVLHTWGSNLSKHIHVHAIVTGGALSDDRERWIKGSEKFLFPVKALSKVFRGKYLALLSMAFAKGRLRLGPGSGEDDFRRLESTLRSKSWNVYCKAPFESARHVVAYLGRYTQKTAIANHRLVGFDGESVRFKWRDYADANQVKIMSLDTGEFIRRFLQHVLPTRFMKIRHYGLHANRDKGARLALCRTLIGQDGSDSRVEPESVRDMMLRVAGIDIDQCPRCRKGTLVPLDEFRPRNKSPP